MALNIEKLWDQAISDLHREDHDAYQIHTNFLAEQGGYSFGFLLNTFLRNKNRPVAIDIINKMSSEHRWKFVSFLIKPGLGDDRYWQFIASVNIDWSKENIEELVRPVLAEDDDSAWRQILVLLWRVDKKTYVKIAQEAVQSSNPHIVEAGSDALENE